MTRLSKTKQIVAAGALILGGVGVGAAVASIGSASAQGSGTSGSTTSTAAPDPSQPQRSDEKLLTGTTATKVRDAALAKYPGATIERVETDSDGVYEAHIVTKAGDHVIVQVGKDFAVTGTQTGGPGGHGDGDGDGPGDGTDS